MRNDSRNQQSKEDFVAEAKAKAEAKWDRRMRTPRPVGRPSQHDIDRNAISEKAKVNAGISGTDFKIWTQARWINEVGAFKGETVPGQLTIKKHLKEYIQGKPFFPLQLTPASLIQAKSLEDQLVHWYAMSIVMAVLAAKSHSRSKAVSLPFSKINTTHRQLCTKHIPKGLRLSEAQREIWLRNKWSGTQNLAPPPTSRRSRKS